ncbi:MAG: tetratricopeptide repeat protein [Candidatus Helarchaeota archaeon]
MNLAIELEKLHKNHYWASKELIWTYITAELNKCSNLDKAKEISHHLFEFNLEDLASKAVAKKMIKLAIDAEDWHEAINWLDKIKQESLTDAPLGKSEWTEKTYVYYNKIKCLFELKKYDECISYCNEVIDIIQNEEVKKFILRLKAKSLDKIDRLEESLTIYEDLCQFKADWWLLHELANVLLRKGKKEEALKKMYQAVSSFRQLDKMVKLLNDIGELSLELGKEEEALTHFILLKLVREEKGWRIDSKLETNLDDLQKRNEGIGNITNIKDALFKCKKYWSAEGFASKSSETRRKRSRRNLEGTVELVDNNKPFCFISMENESIFCFKSDLPLNINNKDIVIFDAIPSYDKKKRRESWRAINIKKQWRSK